MKHIALSIICVLLPALLEAQALPAGVRNGKLPNNATYYIVTNNDAKAYADFALVQKGNRNREAVHGFLADLPHFSKIKPYEYLGSKGIAYGRSGYASLSYLSVNYRFHDVPVYDQTVTDSVLLVIFDLMQTYEKEQALIVSGDVNADKLLERMQTLSMSVTPRQPYIPDSPFVWEPTDSVVFECSRTRRRQIGEVDVTYFSQRLSESVISTTQPLVMELFARQLSDLIARRVREAFAQQNVFLDDVSISHVSSFEPVEQEMFRISIRTDKQLLPRATAILGQVLAEIDTNGASTEEFRLTSRTLARKSAKSAAGASISNERFVDMCISSYLLGTAMVTDRDVDSFISASTLPTDTGLPLLNRYASALLSPDKNVALHYGSPEFITMRDSLLGEWERGWKLGSDAAKRVPVHIDTAKMATPLLRVKLSSTSSEPVTGGKLFTFSNGMRVLYCKAPTDGNFLYGFAVKGGYTSIPGMDGKNGRFVGRMFDMIGTAGLSSSSLHSLLERNGIEMKARVSLSDMTISGSAPDNKLYLVLKSVLSLASSRNISKKDFEYWLACRKFFSEDIDSELLQLSSEYYGHQLNSFANGILVIVGDFEEEDLLPVLTRYAGGFKMGKAVAGRAKLEERFYGDNISADGQIYGLFRGSIRAPMMYSAGRLAALRIARKELQRALNVAYVNAGVTFDCEVSHSIFPRETMTLRFTGRRCLPTGLPEGVESVCPAKGLEIFQQTLHEISTRDIPDDRMAYYRVCVGGEMEQGVSSPQYLLNAGLARFMLGRNIIAGRKGAANSVSSDMVKDVLQAFDRAHIQAEYCNE